MVNSYPNLSHTIEHKPLAYPLRSDLFFWSAHLSKDDKLS